MSRVQLPEGGPINIMDKFILIIALFFAATWLFDDNIKEGEWAVNKITGEEYFIIEYNDVTDEIQVAKDRQGNIVKIKLSAVEFEPLNNAKAEQQKESAYIGGLIFQLQEARLKLAEANPSTVRQEFQKTIEYVEKETRELSPVFRERVWNPETGHYE